MPSAAVCSPIEVTGLVTPSQALSFLNSGSGVPLEWQYGKPKFSPDFDTRFNSSSNLASPAQSRPLSVNHSSLVLGCQSKPTELRTPRATTSMPEPSGL